MYNTFREKLIKTLDRKRDEILLNFKFKNLEPLFGINTDEENIYSKIISEFERINDFVSLYILILKSLLKFSFK